MSIYKAIDQIVEAFIPEMERISEMHESEDQKERHYKAWLRATLQKFAEDVRDSESHNNAEDTGKNGGRPDPAPPLLWTRATGGSLSGESHDQ
jgi:hypothetical protein